jgi:hypothetical protein
MSNSQLGSATESFLLLPKLKKGESNVKNVQAGQWGEQAPGAFQDIAESLDFKSPGEDIKSISSIPSMWARPMVVEMALHQREHKLRSQIVTQWQGMLAAIALSQVRSYPLTTQLLQLEQRNANSQDRFAKSLLELLPAETNCVYKLEPNGKGSANPWRDIYIFLWNNQPVGMTSPSTLVCPAENADWGELEWWSPQDRKLLAPTSKLDSEQRELLGLWLDKLHQALEANGDRQIKQSVSNLRGLIDEFRNSLAAQSNRVKLQLDPKNIFGASASSYGPLEMLGKVIKSQAQTNNVSVVASTKTPAQEAIVIDPDIANQWKINPLGVHVYDTINLGNYQPSDLEQLRRQWRNLVIFTPDDLFLPNFYFIQQEDALPGALLPETGKLLYYDNALITPLLPISNRLLEYFTPEELAGTNGSNGIVQFEAIDNNSVKVVLEIPLSGTIPGQTQTYRAAKVYAIEADNSVPLHAFSALPVLLIWPYFKAQGWQEYYLLYSDGGQGSKTFNIELPSSADSHEFTRLEEGIFDQITFQQNIAQMAEFPEFISCTTVDGSSAGLMLVKSPPPRGVSNKSQWAVGVDFGTSFTNVYANNNDQPRRLELDSLCLNITQSLPREKIFTLDEYFMREELPNIMPFASVLTTRDGTDSDRLIIDGRIYVPPSLATDYPYDPTLNWIKTGLKWAEDNVEINRLFLKHLALEITAQAVNRNINEIDWRISYPSAFSEIKKSIYIEEWREIIGELAASTGITHQYPEDSAGDITDKYRTESTASAQYFADYEEQDLSCASCIDMGGGTSDISIWQQNQDIQPAQIHRCSVKLAGRDLFSHILSKNKAFLWRQFKFTEYDPKQNDNKASGSIFDSRLDAVLKEKSDEWLSIKAKIAGKPEFQELIQIMAIGISGLYYYLGIILNVLDQEQKYTRKEITPVYLGGNGSRLLNWLANGRYWNSTAQMNQFFSRMIAQGSGFADIGVPTRLSQNPKEEVACGLVMSTIKLSGMDGRVADPLIAGEDYRISGNVMDGYSRLIMPEKIAEFAMPEKLKQIPLFLYEFHEALRDLNIEVVKPLSEDFYKPSKDFADNEKLWRNAQRRMSRYASVMTQGKTRQKEIELEPPFILALKGLIDVLAERWAEKWKNAGS